MDKFGIFNLLNSLFSANPSQTNGDSQNTSKENSILSSLFSSDNQPQPPKEKTPEPFLPLQASMVSTMTSHDEFVKRVKEKNKKHPSV